MASGVTISDEVQNAYNDLKLRKTYQFLVFALDSDMKSVVIKEKGLPGADYETFKAHLKEAEDNAECRYGVFDLAFQIKDQTETSKPVYFFWAPETAKVKQKMVYAATNSTLQSKLGTGMALKLQCHCSDDLDKQQLIDELSKK